MKKPAPICPRCQRTVKDKKGRARKLCAACAEKVNPQRLEHFGVKQ